MYEHVSSILTAVDRSPFFSFLADGGGGSARCTYSRSWQSPLLPRLNLRKGPASSAMASASRCSSASLRSSGGLQKREMPAERGWS